jgi:hypothetical protein
LSSPVLKLGANFLGRQWNVDGRVRIGNGDVNLGNKFGWANKNWMVNWFGVLSAREGAIRCNALRLACRYGASEVFLRAENDHKRTLKNFRFTAWESYFKKLVVDYVGTVNPMTKVVLEVPNS